MTSGIYVKHLNDWFQLVYMTLREVIKTESSKIWIAWSVSTCIKIYSKCKQLTFSFKKQQASSQFHFFFPQKYSIMQKKFYYYLDPIQSFIS